MKITILVAAMAACLWVIADANGYVASTSAQGQLPKRPDVLMLAQEGKLGPVTFSHTSHTTKNYNIAGTGPIDCIECHHTAQPASEIAKKPPLKTSWPIDRSTTLTAEFFEKSPADIGVIACRSCHARATMKPLVWPEIPQMKHESSAAILNLTNQIAFHRNCASCHDEVARHRPDTKAPKTAQCVMCHKKPAA